ncbi:MAG: M20/M25/M40 family metallo-hydrolase [Sphaerochaetaceae bacterium]|nr:M20/M25/M40 family metallo-hydrolase [Sphaerochaetaceae bacterium]
MERKETIDLIKRLSEANGISGFEDEAVSIIRSEAAGLGAITEDSLRNLYIKCTERDPALPTLMIDCHTDEIGFMVKCIRPNGLLEFITIGGWVGCNIPAHMVRVRSSDGFYIPGIVSTTPPHFMTDAERHAPVDISKLAIDVGASSDAEVRDHYHIEVGAPVVPDALFSYDESTGAMFGKAFDNRLGCTASLAMMHELAGENLQVNLTAAFASQEEVGTRGAEITAHTVNPDIAIIFEGSPADDTCLPSYQAQTCIRRGPMLRHIDAKMITNPRFLSFALDTAHDNGIPVQRSVRQGGSTNGAPIHLANSGIPCIVIGIPVRYAHTHYCISDIGDFENSVSLGVCIARQLSRQIIASF